MNNDEAATLLGEQRGAIMAAINALNRFERESDDWKAAVRTNKLTEVKNLAAQAGSDLSTWKGQPSPPSED